MSRRNFVGEAATTPSRESVPAADQSARPSPGNASPVDDSPRQALQRQVLGDLHSAGAQSPPRDALPESLRSGMHALSGVDLASVQVHYNSAKPAQLQALAFAQGDHIHLGPGQERHLAHEAWHLVQQRQGRVRPTAEAGGVAINDNQGLEREADHMGARAAQMKPLQRQPDHAFAGTTTAPMHDTPARAPGAATTQDPETEHPVQRFARQEAVDQSPRLAAQRQAMDSALGKAAPLLETGGPSPRVPVVQLNGKKRRARQKNKERKREQRRLDAVDRLQRGSPDQYDRLAPKVASGLAKLDRMQPRKTAARRNIDSRDQRLEEANLPSVVEVGAGEGRFSSAFARKFGDNYEASDIAARRGPNDFLGVAKQAGLRTKFGVNANELGSHFPSGSLDHVVGANPFGVKGVGGASYGLKAENPGGKGKKKYQPDARFLNTARPLLKPGGSVELYGRSNVIRDAKRAKHPTQGLRGEEARAAERARNAISEKYPGENANPYLAITPDELHDLARKTRYRATVKRAKQPSGIGKGGNPDTKAGDKERADEGLKPFTTRFTFTPEEDGYQSGDDDPRVTYLSDDESDWEE